MHIHKVTLLPENYPSTNIYPFCLEIFRTTPCLEFDTPITFFIGENGSGKSTLLRAITRKCGIHIWSNMDKRRFDANPYENELYRFIDVAWTKGKVPGAFFSSELYNYFAQSLDTGQKTTRDFWDISGASRCSASRTGSRSCDFSSQGIPWKVCIFWTSPRPPFHQGASLNCSGCSARTAARDMRNL